MDLPELRVPVQWDPHAGARPERADTRYFGLAFQEMERHLDDGELDVYLTWNPDRLPAYGPRVVAVLLSDDGGRVPRYTSRVRAVFKSYGTTPTLGRGPLRDPSVTGLMELVLFAVRWMRWLPGGAAHARMLLGRRLRRRPAPPAVATIPLGTFNQLDLAPIPIEERPTDVFFAGSVEHERSRWQSLSPKTRSRDAMLRAVRRIASDRPHQKIDLRVTSGFEDSEASSPDAYSRGLMEARVCLAPRGSSIETFRVLEGLRAGCVVVGERLPRHWFYDGSPVVSLDRWGELDSTLSRLLDDPAELRRLHRASLAWWRERCSEEVVGTFMANRLNQLPKI